MACKGRSWESESGYNSSLKLPALSNHVRSGTSFDLAITLRGRLYSINYIFSNTLRALDINHSRCIYIGDM